MKQKKDKCKYCGGKLEAKTTRMEFCSAKCRVYWNRENVNDEKAFEVPIPHIPASKREIVKQVLDDSAKERLGKLEAELASLGNSSYLFDYKRKLKAKIEKLKNLK